MFKNGVEDSTGLLVSSRYNRGIILDFIIPAVLYIGFAMGIIESVIFLFGSLRQ